MKMGRMERRRRTKGRRRYLEEKRTVAELKTQSATNIKLMRWYRPRARDERAVEVMVEGTFVQRCLESEVEFLKGKKVNDEHNVKAN